MKPDGTPAAPETNTPADPNAPGDATPPAENKTAKNGKNGKNTPAAVAPVATTAPVLKIGSDVHYVIAHPTLPHRPAKITSIREDGTLNLFVFTERHDYATERVVQVAEDQAGKGPGTWHWPE